MLWKCYTQYARKFGKLSSGHRTGKRSVFILIPKKGNVKECSNYCTTALTSHAGKVMLQARLQQYMNPELPDVQAAFSKGRGTRDQIVNIRWIIKTATEFQKKAFDWITTNYRKFWKRWEYQTTWPPSWEICRQVRKQQLELDMEQQTGSKSGNEYIVTLFI